MEIIITISQIKNPSFREVQKPYLKCIDQPLAYRKFFLKYGHPTIKYYEGGLLWSVTHWASILSQLCHLLFVTLSKIQPLHDLVSSFISGRYNLISFIKLSED